MAVVSNSSPLIAFAAIEQLSLFPALFESVLIPPAVALEIAPSIPTLPTWLRVESLRMPLPEANSGDRSEASTRVTSEIVVDEPTDLPEGTELELVPLDPGDWLDDADRAALHEALRQSDGDVAADRLVDASEILKELRSR